MNIVKKEIVKDKGKLTLKLFVMVWIVLLIHVLLKLTFNYWQPYVIPNEQLQAISDFIDTHIWLEYIIDFILYSCNGIIMVLCALRTWWFNNKYHAILFISLININFIISVLNPNVIIGTLLIVIILPLILYKKNWKFIILSFMLSNVFLALSLWLEGFVSSNDMSYITKIFLELDYYIMLILNYFVFNLTRRKE
jgi:hypothetical protein